MALLLGIDLGTSYFKVGLFDESGALRGLARVRVDKREPAPGYCELAVNEFWHLLQRGLAEALFAARADAGDIVAMSYASQASTFLLLDERLQPLTPLILWLDSRGEPVPNSLRKFAESESFAQTVGFTGLTGQFAIAKWRWYQENRSDLWARTAHIMTVSDYFTFVLTGQFVGDAGTAGLLGVYDLSGRDWWSTGLEWLGISGRQLSRPLPPGAAVGPTIPRATALLGVPSGVVFAVGGLDHQVAALGSGLGTLADLSISTGTVLAALRIVGNSTATAGCYHGPHFSEGQYYRLAFDDNGAGRLEQFQRKHHPGKSIDELIESAIRSGSRASLGYSSRAQQRLDQHALRILWDIAELHRKLIKRVTADEPVRKVVATGGGSRSGPWLQLKAKCFDMPIVTPLSPEPACLGAAMIASVASGLWPNLRAASMAMVRAKQEFLPTTDTP